MFFGRSGCFVDEVVGLVDRSEVGVPGRGCGLVGGWGCATEPGREEAYVSGRIAY